MIDWEDLLSQGKDALKDATGGTVDVSLPSGDIAKDIGEQLAETHGEATGKAAAGEIWELAKPFAIGALVILGGIFAVVVLKKRK